MSSNEQHPQLVLAACQAKRAADMRNLLNLVIAALLFGTGCAFVWFIIGTLMAVYD